MPNTRATRVASARRRSIAGLTYSARTTGAARTSDWAFLTGSPYPDGPAPASENEALGIPPFGRGVALLANAVAGTEWRAMRWDADAGVALRVANQPSVLTDPDPTSTPWNYRWSAIEDLILYGNHFAFREPGSDGFPLYLSPLPANDVWLRVDLETNGYLFAWNGKAYGIGDLFHVSAGNRSGEPLGRGVLKQYGESLGGALAAETHSGAYFAGAALPPAVLQSPTVLTQGQADDLKSKWRAMTSDREPVILPSGYVLTPIVSNAEQSQLVESRQWNATTVAMMLGIPTYKLGLAGPSMTYQNIESADIEFVRDSVDRYGRPLSEALSKWCMPHGTSVAWDYAGRMRADATTTTAVVTGLVGSGVLTIDEARAMLGRPPLEQSVEEDQTPAGVPELTPSEVPQ